MRQATKGIPRQLVRLKTPKVTAQHAGRHAQYLGDASDLQVAAPESSVSFSLMLRFPSSPWALLHLCWRVWGSQGRLGPAPPQPSVPRWKDGWVAAASTPPHFPRVQAFQHPDSLVTSVALWYLTALYLSWDFEVLLWYYHNHRRQTGKGFGAQQRFSLGFGHRRLPAWVLLPQSCLSVQQVSAVCFWDSLNMLLNYFCRLIEEATWAQALGAAEY